MLLGNRQLGWTVATGAQEGNHADENLITIRNFKRFGEVEVELGSPVVFIGPNNSGKTSAMQALALWDVGVKRWSERWSGQKASEKRPGVTINRRDLIAIPVPGANLLWKDLHVAGRCENRVGRQQTNNVRIDVIVEGLSEGRAWKCGMEFDYANPESFYCRPLRTQMGRDPGECLFQTRPPQSRVAFLPPMSGLAATETRLDYGAVNVRIGEGVEPPRCYEISVTASGKSVRWTGSGSRPTLGICLGWNSTNPSIS